MKSINVDKMKIALISGATTAIGLATQVHAGTGYTAKYGIDTWFDMIIDLGSTILGGFVDKGGVIAVALVGMFLISIALALAFLALGGFEKAMTALGNLTSGMAKAGTKRKY